MTAFRLSFVLIFVAFTLPVFAGTIANRAPGDSLQLIMVNTTYGDTLVRFHRGEFLVLQRNIPEKSFRKEEITGVLNDLTSDSILVGEQWLGLNEITHLLVVKESLHPYTKEQHGQHSKQRKIGIFYSTIGFVLTFSGIIALGLVVIFLLIAEFILALGSSGRRNLFEDGLQEGFGALLIGSLCISVLGLISILIGAIIKGRGPFLRRLGKRNVLKTIDSNE